MGKYANIIINISHENLDRTFQYIIPEELKEQISVGSFVMVPFGKGNREIGGYVLEITDKAEYDVDKLKEIISVSSDKELTEGKLIRLAYFMKQSYGSTMINALKVVLPVKKKIKERLDRTVRLVPDIDEANEILAQYEKKHQTARARLLKELIAEKELDYNLVTAKLNISTATLKYLKEQGVIDIVAERIYRNSNISAEFQNKKILNEEQQKIADDIINDYKNGKRDTYLIRGITGSGKTEIYMEVIDEVIRSGRQAIVLIPEIALTYQTVMRFIRRYGDRVSTLHSKLSDGERYDQFVRAKNKEIDVMIGPRSALFTPFSDVGVIIIDEEHEGSYKSDKMPKYHAREVTIELARLHNASVILGSATPSVNAYYDAKNGNIRLYELDRRAGNSSLPSVKIVDLREELKVKNMSMFSRELKKKMEDRLLKGEQIMLFLNRRGYTGFVTCLSCGEPVKCPHCDVSLTLHRNGRLMCHYCGYEQNNVTQCPKCSSKLISGMTGKKAGTEQIEDEVKKMFPYARTLRMDADTTKTKDSYNNILSTFANGDADILIGTQMIVKGHDFPNVTLVGILLADMSLHVGDYRAAERTFQLITQAAGRAGRADKPGDVIIQTYSPDDYSIVAASHQDYKEFYGAEIHFRSLLSYPPAGHMLLITCESADYKLAEKKSADLAQYIKNGIIDKLKLESTFIIGPADAAIVKLNDVYRRVIYVKAKDYSNLTAIKDGVEENDDNSGVRVSFDFDPLNV